MIYWMYVLSEERSFMDYLIQFQLNIFTIAVFIVLYIIVIRKQKVKSFGKQLLKLAIILGVIAVVLEPLTWIFDGKVFFGSFFLEYSTNFFLYLMAPILGAVMLSYVDYYIFKDRNRLQRRWYYIHFAMITLTMLAINMFYPIYFSVNPETVKFTNGNFQWIHYTLNGFLYIFMTSFVLKNRKQTSKYVVRVFLIFFLLPILGMIVQIIEIQLNFAWTAIALPILVIYVFLESTTGEIDYLTRLYSRLSYEKYVRDLMERKKSFQIVLLDLDKFKKINDEYGHLEGDHVLIQFAQILKKAFHPNELISRLAGDEFLIVNEHGERCDDLIAKTYQILQLDNNPIIKNLKFSYGCEYYTIDNMPTIDQIYSQVDKKMYENKE